MSTSIELLNRPIHGVSIPDSRIAREITELVRDTESPLLFHHSSRVYYFGALAGKHRGLSFDPDLLYAGAMSHDRGSRISTAAPPTASRSTAPIQPATFSLATGFPRPTSTPSGPRSRSTPRPAFRSTCTLSWRWSRPAWKWMCSA